MSLFIMCNLEFEQVYDRNYEALCLYANRLIHSMAESEDLVQEIFVYSTRYECLPAEALVAIYDEYSDYYSHR